MAFNELQIGSRILTDLERHGVYLIGYIKESDKEEEIGHTASFLGDKLLAVNWNHDNDFYTFTDHECDDSDCDYDEDDYFD